MISLIILLLLLPIIAIGIFYALIASCVIHKRILLGMYNDRTGYLFGIIPFGDIYHSLPPTGEYGCCNVQDCKGIDYVRCENNQCHGCRRSKSYYGDRLISVEAEIIGSGPKTLALCQSVGDPSYVPPPTIQPTPAGTIPTQPTPTPRPRPRARVRPTGCPAGKQLWAGLCYKACPAGSTRQGICRCSGHRMSCRTYGAGT